VATDVPRMRPKILTHGDEATGCFVERSLGAPYVDGRSVEIVCFVCGGRDDAPCQLNTMTNTQEGISAIVSQSPASDHLSSPGYAQGLIPRGIIQVILERRRIGVGNESLYGRRP